MNRLSAAPLRQPWLAALAAAFALLVTAQAVEAYRFPSGKPKNERLPEAKSIKVHKLIPARPVPVTLSKPGKNDLPARYTRKHEGTKRMSR